MGLTVITVNYNTTVEVNNIECLFSGLKNIEYIVVDNSSNFKRKYSSTMVLTGNGNIGFGRACNLAVKSAFYDNILFLNPDVTLTISFVDELRKTLQQFDNDAIYGVCVSQTRQSNIYKSKFPFLIYERRAIARESLSNESLPVTFVSGACMFISKKRFNFLGGFDENVFLYAEDLDLCLRNKQENGDNILLTRLTVDHVGGGSEKNGSRFRLIPALRRLKNSYSGHYVILSKRHNKMLSMITAFYLASGLTLAEK
ncbi:glycosyltransferase [Aeromonas caviae]